MGRVRGLVDERKVAQGGGRGLAYIANCHCIAQQLTHFCEHPQVCVMSLYVLTSSRTQKGFAKALVLVE